MGIKGIYNEIGPGQRIALAKIAVDHFEKHGRPLRLAIDISIWLFQIQSGKGGTNPALRTFYYRLLRLISLAIQPLFVFDGPNKPPFKRNKRTGPNVASIPEFLAKQLLKQFGLPSHLAPGEAEAECALLQRKGVVDAVLSEDVDTLMFGSGLTLRNWSPIPTTKTKTPSHVNLYDANVTKAGASGLDREGMILVALMSGGDYVPEGIPGCGPKTACEAARAGFGADLCKINRNDRAALDAWKERLTHELRTNESKLFKQKHRALVIPDEFPRSDILGYYTHPVVSADDRVERMKTTLQWDQDIDIPALRSFCADAFDWTYISGAKHFARKLAPSLLVKQLRLRSLEAEVDDLFLVAKAEAKLVQDIYLQRQHPSTDNMRELRISFVPLNLVPIDLDAEEPDPELAPGASDSEDENVVGEDDGEDQGPQPTSPSKTRKPTKYDPSVMQKAWIPEIFIKIGVPLKAQDFAEAHRDARRYEAMKAVRKRNEKANRKKVVPGGATQGAMDQFTKVTRPATSGRRHLSKTLATDESQPSAPQPVSPRQAEAIAIETIDLSGVPKPSLPAAERVHADALPRVGIETVDLSGPAMPSSAPPRNEPSASQRPPKSTFRLPPPPPECPETPKKLSQLSIVELMSPHSRSREPRENLVPCKRSRLRAHSDSLAVPDLSPPASPSGAMNRAEDGFAPLPPSVNTRKRRSPLRRTKTVPNATVVPLAGLSDDARAGAHQSNVDLSMAETVETVDLSSLPPGPSTECSRPETPDAGCQANIREVVCISSSPATPNRSAQRPISERLSPSRKDIATPSPIRYTSKDTAIVAAAGSKVGARKQVIRLRDSMHGAFAVEDAEAHAQAASSRKTSPRKRNRGVARGGKVWRASEVELLDLTQV